MRATRDYGTLRERASVLHAKGFTGAEIARQFDLGSSTVYRWLNPAYAERTRVLARTAKARRTGVCEQCGGETRYNGGKDKPVSRLCDSCAHAPRTHCIRGHELTPENRVSVGKRGGFTCRICRNAYMRDFQRRRYAEDPAFRERKRLRNARRYAKENSGV